MKLIAPFFILSSIPLLLVSCAPPQSIANNGAGGVFQDPNNPYAVPGVSNQGGGQLPVGQGQFPAPNGEAPYQPIPSTPINPPASAPVFTPSSPAPSISSSGGSSHTVASGDTLWGLSRKYGVSVTDIRQANGLSGDTIVTGQTLSIPR